jgi:hypothetical protein
MTAAAPAPASSGKGQAELSRHSAVQTSPNHDLVYIWRDAEPYKNDILKAYQKKLNKRGITDTKLFVAQLIQENGSLDPLHTTGDHGCAVGIIQFNACIHAKVSAKRFLQLHPEWKSTDYQLEQMADMVAARYTKYDGDIMRTVVAHNRPVPANAGRDTPAGYFRSVSSRTSLLQAL